MLLHFLLTILFIEHFISDLQYTHLQLATLQRHDWISTSKVQQLTLLDGKLLTTILTIILLLLIVFTYSVRLQF